MNDFACLLVSQPERLSNSPSRAGRQTSEVFHHVYITIMALKVLTEPRLRRPFLPHQSSLLPLLLVSLVLADRLQVLLVGKLVRSVGTSSCCRRGFRYESLWSEGGNFRVVDELGVPVLDHVGGGFEQVVQPVHWFVGRAFRATLTVVVVTLGFEFASEFLSLSLGLGPALVQGELNLGLNAARNRVFNDLSSLVRTHGFERLFQVDLIIIDNKNA